jgi:hypothetical protein
MSHDPRRSSSSLNRRTALAAAGAAATLLSLGHQDPAAAQAATPTAMAAHPVVGAWLVMTPPPPSPVTFAADGLVTLGGPVNYVDPALGITFQTAALGVWEPTGERSVRFTAVQTLTDANGTFLGTITIQGRPSVSADGQILTDNDPESRLTMRDATNAIVSEIGGPVGVMGTRISPSAIVFPEATPEAGTPTS